MDGVLTEDARGELEALQAIYGDDGSVVTITGPRVVLIAESSDGARAVTLDCLTDGGYPAVPLRSFDVDGRRGVPHERVLELRAHLQRTQATLLGMPVLFALVEATKQFLDGNSAAEESQQSDEAYAAERESRPLNHQVGNPLIMEGTRCSENVFLAWREQFMEWRSKQRAAAAEARLREQGAGLTGKQMFVQGLVQLKHEGGLADAAELEAVERGANALAAIDTSLFTEDVDE